VLNKEAQSALLEKLRLGFFAVFVHDIPDGAETDWGILGHGLGLFFLVLMTENY
jgi:hypothetical protein